MLSEFAKKTSEEYYHFIDSFSKTDFESEKLLGKFYTDYDTADDMCAEVVSYLTDNHTQKNIKIIDPFCGDGRLITKLISRLSLEKNFDDTFLSITMWDIDKSAVQKAEENIHKCCIERTINCAVTSKVTDAFIEYHTVCSSYDVCITNPPWVLLKPQKTIGKDADNLVMQQYKDALLDYDGYVKSEFLLSQPSSKFGRWGTNLARCGTEVALRLINENGVCGFVSPASLLSDQVSGNLRKWIFESFNVLGIDYYPAEMKLYGCADVASITMVVSGSKHTNTIEFRKYSDKYKYTRETIEPEYMTYIKNNHYCIPLKTGINSLPIMSRFVDMPTTLKSCDAFGLSFTRELDETRVMDKLSTDGKIIFAKGYMVDRYSFSCEKLFLNENKVTPPQSSYEYKIVWRDVSRDSQLRRIKATILPPGYICGNSLGVICGAKDNLQIMKVILALMNSLIFEYKARSLLVSNHVSAGVVKKIHIPQPKENDYLINLVDEQLNGKNVETRIESVVACLYGVSVDEYSIILNAFDFADDIKANLLNDYRHIQNEWSALNDLQSLRSYA